MNNTLHENKRYIVTSEILWDNKEWFYIQMKFDTMSPLTVDVRDTLEEAIYYANIMEKFYNEQY